jgi:hypothetical protein
MKKIHSFHIPVMGTGFSIDTPVKVAQYGISSVISLVDDTLIEEMRQCYCQIMNEEYIPITKYQEDFRARRITAYLDLIDRIVKQKFETVKASRFEIGSEVTKYFEMLPEKSPLKSLYKKMLTVTDPEIKRTIQEQLRAEMKPGSIDVNIMTKLDRTNYAPDRIELPAEFSDALAALRGYAKSKLNSAIVLSAGINRRLYSYFEKFEDFYADATGTIKKKIILKVSDYRSSIIQGRFFAKKGLWVSEYRVESGLNCGGHAFASDGFLMGPILQEFKNKKEELIAGLHHIYNEALKLKKHINFDQPHDVSITAQGGIGTVREDQFLLEHYQIDGTGWATPFLLCPEATNVDEDTLQKLSAATEDDLYLSDVSPLGVPFNNLRNNNSDLEKQRRVQSNRPGSACPKGYLVSNVEFTERPICSASRQYQKLKIDQLESLNLNPAVFQKKYAEIVQKACICNDLAESPLINHHIEKKGVKRFTAVCPGPNMAYFSKIVSLKEMVDHIYGRINLLNKTYRPNMFIKELKMYVDYLKKEVQKHAIEPTEKQIAYFNEFKQNLLEGIEYYFELFPRMVEETEEYRQKAISELEEFKQKIEDFWALHNNIFGHPFSCLIPAGFNH